MTDSRLVIQSIKGATVVTFQDPNILETMQIQRIANTLYELVDKQAQKRILLDFSEVKFLSSQAIGVLLTLNKKSKAIKGEVCICGIRPELMKVFKITRIDSMFQFFAREQDAIAAWEGRTTTG